MRSLPVAAASQNGFVSGFTGGAGIVRCWVAALIGLLPSHDQRRAAVARAERAARAVRERDVAILHLDFRMRFAAELPHSLDYLRQPAAIRGMVVAEPT